MKITTPTPPPAVQQAIIAVLSPYFSTYKTYADVEAALRREPTSEAAEVPPKAVSRKEACAMLSVSLSTLDRAVRRGAIHPVKIVGSSRVLYPISELQKLLSV